MISWEVDGMIEAGSSIFSWVVGSRIKAGGSAIRRKVNYVIEAGGSMISREVDHVGVEAGGSVEDGGRDLHGPHAATTGGRHVHNLNAVGI